MGTLFTFLYHFSTVQKQECRFLLMFGDYLSSCTFFLGFFCLSVKGDLLR